MKKLLTYVSIHRCCMDLLEVGIFSHSQQLDPTARHFLGWPAPSGSAKSTRPLSKTRGSSLDLKDVSWDFFRLPHPKLPEEIPGYPETNSEFTPEKGRTFNRKYIWINHQFSGASWGCQPLPQRNALRSSNSSLAGTWGPRNESRCCISY